MDLRCIWGRRRREQARTEPPYSDQQSRRAPGIHRRSAARTTGHVYRSLRTYAGAFMACLAASTSLPSLLSSLSVFWRSGEGPPRTRTLHTREPRWSLWYSSWKRVSAAPIPSYFSLFFTFLLAPITAP
ncbi:hypothetical protein GQ53DRAFT_496596 [Thozetella sp. PMI_491]|nr:hypothetical protein GQ53DRAFT_496596 [Thozetella sp. PMI_491]